MTGASTNPTVTLKIGNLVYRNLVPQGSFTNPDGVGKTHSYLGPISQISYTEKGSSKNLTENYKEPVEMTIGGERYSVQSMKTDGHTKRYNTGTYEITVSPDGDSVIKPVQKSKDGGFTRLLRKYYHRARRV